MKILLLITLSLLTAWALCYAAMKTAEHIAKTQTDTIQHLDP